MDGGGGGVTEEGNTTAKPIGCGEDPSEAYAYRLRQVKQHAGNALPV